MDLVPYLYWERQEAGSQLCAQHCLNNLLQQHTYSEFDLAEIAKRLDNAENAALSSTNQNKKSYNYDDTGFFSISVLERAMEVWDLALVRWRGEAMKPYQDRPEDQAAFVLNLSSHWIPLRRFSPHPLPPSSTKRWYNLNSFLPNGPEWISPTYLRMVLAQAEEEGYSVFVVRKATPGAGEGHDTKEGQGWADGGVGVLPECEADRIAIVLGEPVSRTGGVNSPSAGSRGAGSSRVPLASLNPDQPTVDPSSISPPAGPSSPAARRRRRQEDLTDNVLDENAQTPPIRPPRNSARIPSRDPLEDETGTFPQDPDVPVDDDEELDDNDVTDADMHHARGGTYGAMDFAFQSRSYDDEDAALQAALKASMDDVPKDWVAPVLEPKEKPIVKKPKAPPAQPAPPATIDTAPISSTVSGPASGSKFTEELDDEEEEDEPPAAASAEEIRKKRLAKFGQS